MIQVDEDDADLLLLNLTIDRDGYAQIAWTGIRVHKVIAKRMGLNGQIDHQDNDKLNNKRTNLRLATGSENNINKEVPINATGFRGVSYHNKSGKYQVYIGHRGKNIFLGCFDCPIKAAKKYDDTAERLYPNFAKFNLK